MSLGLLCRVGEETGDSIDFFCRFQNMGRSEWPGNGPCQFSSAAVRG